MTKDEYVRLISDLLSKEGLPRDRERRVREANRKLYRAVVYKHGTDAQADLALAQAAQKEQP